MAGTTYSSPLQARVVLKVNDRLISSEDKVISEVPIMVKVRLMYRVIMNEFNLLDERYFWLKIRSN